MTPPTFLGQRMTDVTNPQETAEDKQETAQQKKKGKYSRLTPAQWKRIGTMWELGEVTIQELSKKYGPAPEHISRKFKELGFKHNARAGEYGQKIKKEVDKRIEDDAKKWADRIRDTKEEHYEQITTLNRLAMTEIALAKKDGRPLATADPNLKAIYRAIQINKTAREERYSILGLDQNDGEDDNLPELTIREMTAAEIDDIRDEQRKAGGDEFDPLDVLANYIDPDAESDNDVVGEGDDDTSA